jgi:hypothetical protein
MKGYEIVLKSGVAIVREDEVTELINALFVIKGLPEGYTFRDETTQAYLDYEAAREILQPQFSPDQEETLVRRIGRLWWAIGKLAMRNEIAYDAYCRQCEIQLSQHLSSGNACTGMSRGSKNVVVSISSLRRGKALFMSKRIHYVGEAARKDYMYLVENLPDV